MHSLLRPPPSRRYKLGTEICTFQDKTIFSFMTVTQLFPVVFSTKNIEWSNIYTTTSYFWQKIFFFIDNLNIKALYNFFLVS